MGSWVRVPQAAPQQKPRVMSNPVDHPFHSPDLTRAGASPLVREGTPTTISTVKSGGLHDERNPRGCNHCAGVRGSQEVKAAAAAFRDRLTAPLSLTADGACPLDMKADMVTRPALLRIRGWPEPRQSIFFGRGRLSAAMIATNSSMLLPPPSRGLRARSWPTLLTCRC